MNIQRIKQPVKPAGGKCHFTGNQTVPRDWPRAAGILLPVSSLPSPYGIGTFGIAARTWVDFLHAAGQTYWQVLPLGPTGYADSPYQSFSAFAGNPYFIDLDKLHEDGLLRGREYENFDWGSDETQVDYGRIYRHHEVVLRKAYSRFKPGEGFAAFSKRNSYWLDDYALYMAAKQKNGLHSWERWPDDIRLREPDALRECTNKLSSDINYHKFVQYIFFRQWGELKRYANSKGISIIGDIPIYVAMDSADAWSRSELFYLDQDRLPVAVAGVPPDAFSKTGQLWGNPLYRWDVMAKDGYSWWMQRLKACFDMYDVLRIDHFRGLESYYAIPYGAKTAEKGAWRRGPGYSFIRAVNESFPNNRIIAEDLGVLTERVKRLQQQSGYPGMKILQFAFDSREESDYLPHNYDKNCIVYTGTHDNDTVLGWFESAPPADVEKALQYTGLPDRRDGHMALIRAALGSVGHTAIIPMADYLGLGAVGRINTPSTIGGRNWCWRMKPNNANPVLAKEINQLTQLYGRGRDIPAESDDNATDRINYTKDAKENNDDSIQTEHRTTFERHRQKGYNSTV